MGLGQLYVGTSGWSYDDWSGIFYPEDLPKREMLPHYAQRFNTVEINASFYRIPFENMIKGWRNKVPDRFMFSVKGHRRVTHYNKLVDIDETLYPFLDRIKGIGQNLGPVLWQLPPSLEKNYSKLKGFLDKLPDDLRFAIEFRDNSWLDEDIFEMLNEYNIAYVWVSSKIMDEVFRETANFIYARFHGLSDGFDYDYSKDELRPWAKQISNVLTRKKDCFIYFNNDKDGMALKSIKKLKELLEKDL